METEVIEIKNASPETEEALKKAGEIIRAGGLVAFPTETVYGLGADALNAQASARIYAAKGRPSDNPLIVHVCEFSQVDEIAREVPQEARRVMERFWPGPLTIILKKKACVPDGTTGGLSTVAIRMPSHPSARAFIRESGRMIAAPSANTSGRPSPTLASHVYEDMKGKIPLILDGGPVGIGIESTIIDMSAQVPTILRPGYITRAMLEEVLPRVDVDPAVTGRTMKKDVVAKAPGMKYRHYAPKGQLTLVEGKKEKVIHKINELVNDKIKEGYQVGVIGTDETISSYSSGMVRSIGSREKPETVAANLYRILREFDDMGCDYMYSESFFEQGLGNAIMNRMLKASGYHLISL
ncbi:MAG: threonylcarbamoyl-AMP synthase [Eubacterium sp.]|nr:threonylcarbamoyl-AMP synthase [Eubacterium sp.]MDD7210625.1 L-threonylcarbamoyladenylate synthase [Lachnospiraceae bacterium]MDY5498078.1 L-threonylcarbamoyladenylate synthase [Anaerobutyricum sp.]